jgi:hypothetical protein
VVDGQAPRQEENLRAIIEDGIDTSFLLLLRVHIVGVGGRRMRIVNLNLPVLVLKRTTIQY